MQETYDVVKSVLSAKSDERMIAFAGFQMRPDSDESSIDGVLKIAAFARSDGSGYLTLTFVLDLDQDSARTERLSVSFHRASQETLQQWLGPDFEMLLEIPLNTFTQSSQFYIEELHLYFRRLAGREHALLEGHILPALSEILSVQFDSMQWLPDGQTEPSEQSSLTALLEDWLVRR